MPDQPAGASGAETNATDRAVPGNGAAPDGGAAPDAAAARGREAARQHDWAAAVAALQEADGQAPLPPEDLELLATAAWWSASVDESNAALDRAFQAYSAAGRRADAARAALSLTYQSFRALNMPVGSGWLARAARLLEDTPEGAMHARLAIFEAVGHLQGGNLADGIAATERAIDIARRHDAPNELFMATSFRGMANAFRGEWQQGLTDIDESAAAASSGELDMRVASDIYCNTISTCRTIGDLERAAQWADEGERWMVQNGSGGYPGVCKVHRAELKMLRGRWAEAEDDARNACDELRRFNLLDGLGYANYAIGEVRLRKGDLEGAATAFDTAYEYGHDAQPGLALLQLARGEIDDAQRSLGRALEMSTAGGVADRGTRARLLPAQVDVALAAGDLAAARSAVEELEAIATEFGRPLFQAGALAARGDLLLGEQRASEASPLLGQSWRLWQNTNLPYEAARARLHYAQALVAEGDLAPAKRDLTAARSGFERLGATLDVERADALLAEIAAGLAAGPAGGLAIGQRAGGTGAVRAEGATPGARATRTFMFTDIVTSTDLVGLIGDEAWSELLHWHDRELRAAFAGHHGEEVSHTGDGFFVAFEGAPSAIECAIDIQRRLQRHRREHGFAPWVRIGLHTAEATREGRNFSGRGVHVAARVGAAAEREEILVTAGTLAAAGSVPTSDSRAIKLKGVAEPVEVRAVTWR